MNTDTKPVDAFGEKPQGVLLGTIKPSLPWGIVCLFAAGGFIFAGFYNISSDFWLGVMLIVGALAWLSAAWLVMISKRIIAHPEHRKLMVDKRILGKKFSVQEYSYDDFTSAEIVHNITIEHNHSGTVDSDDYARRGLGSFTVNLRGEEAGKVPVDSIDTKIEAEIKAAEVEKVLVLDAKHREYRVNIHRKSRPDRDRDDGDYNDGD